MLPSWVILALDIVITVVAVIIAFMLRFSPAELAGMGNAILMALGLTLLFNLVFFWVFHTYSNVLRFSSFADVLHISAALVSAFVACIIVTVISLYGFRFE